MFSFNQKSQSTDKYDLLIVGHSYGAGKSKTKVKKTILNFKLFKKKGVGAILSILLKQAYPSLKCYSFSPLGGILSESCMRETKQFITTVILGKDMIPRLKFKISNFKIII